MAPTMVPGATVEVTSTFHNFSKKDKKRTQPPRVSERSPHPSRPGTRETPRPSQQANCLGPSGAQPIQKTTPPTQRPTRKEQRNPSENSSTHPTTRDRYTTEGSSTHPENYPARHPPSNHQDKKNETHPGTAHPTQRPKADTIPTCSSINPGRYPATDPLRDHRRPWEAQPATQS